MDFQGYVNLVNKACCVMSIKKEKDDLGEIRIICANDQYKKAMGEDRYHDNMLYSDLVPKDRKFELFIHDTAIDGKPRHTYVETKGLDAWTDMILIPLVGDEEYGYCQFMFEFTKDPDPDRLSNVNIDTAVAVIQNCAIFRSSDDFIHALSSVTENLRKKSDAERCVVIGIQEDIKNVYVLSESIMDGYKPMREILPTIPYEVVTSWIDTVGDSNSVIVTNEADMAALEKRNPEWVKSLRNDEVHSICFYPMFQNNRPIGYLYVINFDTMRLAEIKELIELTSFFITSELITYNLMTKLEDMSSLDMLTGVFNRNAMNNRVDQFVVDTSLSHTPYGVVYIDLNGLKRVNDRYGHEAGDQMLLSGAQIITEVFRGDEVYRAGGDEFTVISFSNEEEFYAKVEKLRDRMSYPNEITCAAGLYYAPIGGDIRKAMSIADAAMYLDKETFYEEHPELKNR